MPCAGRNGGDKGPGTIAGSPGAMKGDSALNGRVWAQGELGAVGWRASDPLTGTLNTAPGNGRAKMGTTILGTPLEAPGGGKGELKQSPRYRGTKTAPGVAYGAHKGAQGRTRAHKGAQGRTARRNTIAPQHKRAASARARRIIPNRCQGMRMPR